MSLLLGCNNGEIEKLENKNKFLGSVVNLGNEFLNVFTSFGDMISGETLGFKKESKKSAVRDYFQKVHDKVEGTKTALNKIVENMEKEGNPNASAVKTKVEELINNKLSNIIEGAKTVSGAIGDADSELIGDVADQKAAAAVAGQNIENLLKGIKSIVAVVLIKEGKHDAGTDKKASDLSARTANGEGEAGKLFAANAGTAGNSNAKKAAADAVKAVGAVTGADILKAIVTDGKDSAANAAKQNAKDGTIAGAIALRAMAKGGKFAGPSDSNNDEYTAEVKGVAISAVTKALDTLTISIRKTIDEGLKEVKGAMKINANDTPVTIESKS